KLQQGLSPDRAQRAHIRILHAVKKPHAPTGEAPGGELMPADTAGLAIAARARSDHEIVAAGPDGLDQPGNAARLVGPVPVHEDDDLSTLGCHRRHEACSAIAGPRIDHLRACGFRPHCGSIATAAVGHDDAGYDGAGEAAYHLRD